MNSNNNNNDFNQFLAQTSPVDPLFDDWLVKDALEDNDDSSSPSAPSSNTNNNVSSSSSSYLTTPPLESESAVESNIKTLHPHSPISPGPATPVSMPSVAPSPIIAQHNPLMLAIAALLAQKQQISLTPPVNMTGAAATTTAKKSRTPRSNSPAAPSNPPSSAPRRKRCNEELSPQDEAAIKRQKNTDAARRSRLKKVLKMEALERRVAELEKANSALLLRVAVLDSEKTNLANKESSYEQRIKMLESQLSDAHKALAQRPLQQQKAE